MRRRRYVVHDVWGTSYTALGLRHTRRRGTSCTTYKQVCSRVFIAGTLAGCLASKSFVQTKDKRQKQRQRQRQRRSALGCWLIIPVTLSAPAIPPDPLIQVIKVQRCNLTGGPIGMKPEQQARTALVVAAYGYCLHRMLQRASGSGAARRPEVRARGANDNRLVLTLRTVPAIRSCWYRNRGSQRFGDRSGV